MELFEVAEQMDETREKLGGVCELLDCAAASPDEIGAAGLAMLAERAMSAYGELSCAVAMLEAAQAEREEGDEDAGDGGILVI